VVKPVINGLFGSRVPVINNNVRLEDQEWEHARCKRRKITVIKGASGLQFGGDAVGGLIIIEPVSVKRHSFLENYSKPSVKWQRRFHELKSTQGNDKGWNWGSLWRQRKYNSESGTFLTSLQLLQHYNWNFECFTYGECERFVQLLLIKFLLS
jgi:hypothetical protein